MWGQVGREGIVVDGSMHALPKGIVISQMEFGPHVVRVVFQEKLRIWIFT